MRTFGFFAVASTMILTGSIGTITDPELADPSGDIEYEPTYLGPRDHQAADIEAAWMEYEAESDAIAIHMQVPNTFRFDGRPGNFEYNCTFQTNLTVEQNFSGRIEAGWTYDPRNGQSTSGVLYFENPEITGDRKYTPLPHTFGLVVGEPGFYVWKIERETLQLRGTEATDFYALCSFYEILANTPDEFVWEGGYLGGADHGFGRRSFEYGDVRPAAAPAVEEPMTMSETPTSSWTEDGTTSALGLVGVMAVLSVVVLLRRKR